MKKEKVKRVTKRKKQALSYEEQVKKRDKIYESVKDTVKDIPDIRPFKDTDVKGRISSQDDKETKWKWVLQDLEALHSAGSLGYEGDIALINLMNLLVEHEPDTDQKKVIEDLKLVT